MSASWSCFNEHLGNRPSTYDVGKWTSLSWRNRPCIPNLPTQPSSFTSLAARAKELNTSQGLPQLRSTALACMAWFAYAIIKLGRRLGCYHVNIKARCFLPWSCVNPITNLTSKYFQPTSYLYGDSVPDNLFDLSNSYLKMPSISKAAVSAFALVAMVQYCPAPFLALIPEAVAVGMGAVGSAVGAAGTVAGSVTAGIEGSKGKRTEFNSRIKRQDYGLGTAWQDCHDELVGASVTFSAPSIGSESMFIILLM